MQALFHQCLHTDTGYAYQARPDHLTELFGNKTHTLNHRSIRKTPSSANCSHHTQLLRHFHENFKYTKCASKCPPNRFVIQVLEGNGGGQSNPL